LTNANIFEFCLQLFSNNRSFGMGMFTCWCITPIAQMSRTRYCLRAKASPAVVAV